MKPRILAILSIAVLFGAADARAQDAVDVQGRAALTYNLDLPKQWEVDLEYQLRMVEDMSTYRGSYFTLSLSRGLTKDLTALCSYRRAETVDGPSNRYALGLEYERSPGRFSVAFRPLYQYRKWVAEEDDLTGEPADDDETGAEGDSFLRTRLRVKYAAARRVDVYASVEPTFAFGEDYAIDNWRNTLGVRYEYSKNKWVDLYYVLRPDYGKSYNRTFHSLGIAFRFRTKVKGS